MVTEISEQDPLFNYNEGITLSEIWSGEDMNEHIHATMIIP